MPTLFGNKKRPAMSVENSDAESIKQLVTKISEFHQYNENLALEVRASYDKMCEAHAKESRDILYDKRQAHHASDSKGMSACEERLTRWFNSKLSSLVNDYSESAKEFSTCSAFALGTSDRYRKIKFLLANQDDYLQETPATQAAIDQLRESIQKFDMSMKHGLYYHAYQHEMEDTYTPPAVRLGG